MSDNEERLPPRFFDWTPDGAPAVIEDVTVDGGWDSLVDFYTEGRGSKPLERIVEIARSHDVQSVLCERRYIDADYRSEHSRFYSTTFRRYPSVCHRLHFFACELPTDLDRLDAYQEHYKGYSIMRPLPQTPVGRTMIAPPPDLDDTTACLVNDRAHLFGAELNVRSMPFVSQDAQYSVCAHASIWMVLYHAHLAHGLPRRLPDEIHEFATGGVVVGRQTPSEGLSVNQLLNALHRAQLSATAVQISAAPQDNAPGPLGLNAMACRYINSQMPPIVSSDSHVWVLVAYRLLRGPSGHTVVQLYRHDDARGPFLKIDNPWAEQEPQHTPWRIMIPPLPQKSYITGERAEALGVEWLQLAADEIGAEHLLRSAADAGRLTFRAYATLATDYKARLADRGLPEDVRTAYRLAQWPRYVWVIEAVDRELRDQPLPDVLAEVIIDATAHQHSELESDALLAMHVCGKASFNTPDFNEVILIDASEGFTPYSTGMPAREAGAALLAE